MSDAENTSVDGSLPERIDGRRTQHLFPVIEPDELTCKTEQAIAAEQKAFVSESEVEPLRVHLEEQYAEYLVKNPGEDKDDEEEQYALWCQTDYYSSIR